MADPCVASMAAGDVDFDAVVPLARLSLTADEPASSPPAPADAGVGCVLAAAAADVEVLDFSDADLPDEAEEDEEEEIDDLLDEAVEHAASSAALPLGEVSALLAQAHATVRAASRRGGARARACAQPAHAARLFGACHSTLALFGAQTAAAAAAWAAGSWAAVDGCAELQAALQRVVEQARPPARAKTALARRTQRNCHPRSCARMPPPARAPPDAPARAAPRRSV
jgi:hypothetical protein